MKKGKIIFPILIFIIVSLSILLFTLLNNKELSIKRATSYLKNKINSETPYYTKTTTNGDIKNCINCTRTSSGSVFYSFFIFKAIKDDLTENEKSIVLKKVDTGGKDLWSYDGKEQEISMNDADDTAFAMRTLKTSGKEFKLQDIEYFYDDKKEAFSSFVKTPNNSVIYKTNFMIHPEVNANIYNLFNESKQNHDNFKINTDLIKNSQLENGSFKNSYYFSKYYSTYMFLNFLCNYKEIDNDLIAIKDKGINFILNTQNKNGLWGEKNGNVYETALSLTSLKSCKISNEQIKKGEKALIKKQKINGSWISKDNILWIFNYNEKEQWTSYVNDILSTSLAITALK